MVTIEEILEYPLPSTPACPVELIGGVMVFCDPETRLSIPLMDGRWKVAVGVHPRKVLQCSDSHLARIRMLLDSNPLVKALGEIGLDRTEPDHMWAEQDRMFKRLLTLSRPDKVLVLHLRGSSNVHSSDVLMAALHHVGRACSTSQKVHLHCFTGTRSDVEDWLERFPNCYFGFTARASTFNHFQLEGLRAVPHDRILVETDSPYMPVDGENRTNTPAYIGDVAQLIARLRGVPLEELLAVTVTNGQQLYQ
ncbi:MAG: TatD family hydrolase [Candidatus Thiodiazotropha sp.]